MITLGETFNYTDLDQAPPDDLPTLDDMYLDRTKPRAEQAPDDEQTATDPASITPDINNDNIVNTSDLGLIRQAINQGTNDPRYDLNQDGIISDADIQIVLDNWGPLN